MRILVLCGRVPYPLTDGESLRIFNYAKHLAARHDLDLVCVGNPEYVDPAVHEVFRRVEVFPASPPLPRMGAVRRIFEAFRVDSFAESFPEVTKYLTSVVPQRDYDVIWTSTDLVRCIPASCGVPTLTDVCDDGVLLLRRELARTEGVISRMRIKKRLSVARRFERRFFAPTDACLFVSDVDAESFRDLAPGARTEVIPNGVDVDYFAPTFGSPDSATLVFEGSMDFEPNADAAVYFCREILPLIQARRPDVRMLLVGRDPTPEVRKLASETVTVTGRVDDVRPYLAQGTVFVCPLRMGAGIKNKILQAWSMGKVVVATPVSLGGLDYTDGQNLLVRNEPKAFVDAILHLLDDPDRCAEIGQRARETVVRSYRWEARTQQFESLLASIVAPYSVHRLRRPRFRNHRHGTGAPRVLMFALQFPPYGLSTGRLRTLGFLRHLPATGWVPIVVTAREAAFADQDARTLADVPKGARVIRASGGDLARFVAFRGIYPRWVATPDRWNVWAVGAAIAGLKAVKTHRVDALWATFPVPSAVLAGLIVHRFTGLPLVADLRDPMVYETWPETPWDRRVYAWLERRLVRAASAVVLTTPRACEMYRQRYSDLPQHRFCEIANGIDEVDGGAIASVSSSRDSDDRIILLHSGLMEIPDRDPTAFFKALRILVDRGLLPKRPLKVVMRASGREIPFRAAADALGIGKLVALESRVPYDVAIAELQSATGLILFQGRACNRQIPAKAYEYLASQRPIVGLMDPLGDTHALLHGKWGVPYCADMADPESIAEVLHRFFADVEAGKAYVPPDSLLKSYGRRAQALELGRLLDGVCGPDADSSQAERGALTVKRLHRPEK